MTLKFPLPEEVGKMFHMDTVQFVLPLDLDEQDRFDAGYFIVDGTCLYIVRRGEIQKRYPVAEYQDFTTEMCIGGGFFYAVRKEDGCKVRLCHFTMEHAARYAIIARKLQLRSEGKPEEILNDEPDRKCIKCGRVLPEGSGICPFCTDRGAILKRLFGMMKKYLPAIFRGFCYLMVMTLTGILMPMIYSQLVNRVYLSTAESRGDGFLWIFGGLIGAYSLCKLLNSGFIIVRGRLLASVSTEMMHDLRMMMFEKIQKLSVSFSSKRTVGDLMNRVTSDTAQIQTFIQEEAVTCLNQIILLLFSGVLMFVMDWKLAIIVILPAPVIVLCMRLFWGKIHNIYRNLRILSSKSNSVLQDVFSGIRVVKSFGTEDKEVQRFADVSAQYREKTVKNEYFWATFRPLIGLLRSCTYFSVALIGGYGVIRGTMSIGQLTAFTMYANYIYDPITYMIDLPRNFANTVTAASRVFDVLDQPSEVSNSENPVELEIRGAVKFDNVTFGYKSYEPVAEDINIDVKPGEMIGLVGHSGSGKSTLTNLIMRFYDVDAGALYIDGVNIKDISQEKFHSQIGVVLQETYLFAGTIMENIRYAKPDATEEEIIEACKIANAHEFITGFPDGYETRIGEKGQRLSGGEKQRIAIARAIICDPGILILDEATSSLDTENELVIQTALQRLIKGRTTFAIAHRLSTLKNADRLVVLDHGRVAEIGTHNELIDKRGIYYDMVMAQLNMTRMLGDVEITDSQFIDEIKKK